MKRTAEMLDARKAKEAGKKAPPPTGAEISKRRNLKSGWRPSRQRPNSGLFPAR